MKNPKRRKLPSLPCQILSGRRSLGVGTCNLLRQHEVDIHLKAPDIDRLCLAFEKTENLTLKVKLKYPQAEALFYKVTCIISFLKMGHRDSADLEVIFDGALSRTTSAALSA